MQHDDHIWLTAGGSAWAILRVHRSNGRAYRFDLWRGYKPDLEFAYLDIIISVDWDSYCAKAAMILTRSGQND
jgi:hypothetical protein